MNWEKIEKKNWNGKIKKNKKRLKKSLKMKNHCKNEVKNEINQNWDPCSKNAYCEGVDVRVGQYSPRIQPALINFRILQKNEKKWRRKSILITPNDSARGM